MERTQIYLSRAQTAALDREARRLGQTRSHLIRAAIDRTYLTDRARDELTAALAASFGAWKDVPETGEDYVARIREGCRRRSEPL
jgi:hypothetical protein